MRPVPANELPRVREGHAYASAGILTRLPSGEHFEKASVGRVCALGLSPATFLCVPFRDPLRFRLTHKQTMLLWKPHPLRLSGVLHDIIATNTEICTRGSSATALRQCVDAAPVAFLLMGEKFPPTV